MGKRKDYSVSNARIPALTANLRTLIENSGGATKFAEEIGYSSAAVNHWYNGNRTPDAEALTKIGRVKGISVDYLLGLSDCPSLDKDIRQVCEYTGLSQTAVSALAQYSPRGKEILSDLLSTDEFQEFIVIISCLAMSSFIFEIERTEKLSDDGLAKYYTKAWEEDPNVDVFAKLDSDIDFAARYRAMGYEAIVEIQSAMDHLFDYSQIAHKARSFGRRLEQIRGNVLDVLDESIEAGESEAEQETDGEQDGINKA